MTKEKNCNLCEKIFFAICATTVAMLFAVSKFGGLKAMEKCNGWCKAIIVVGFGFLIFMVIALFCCGSKDGGDINLIPFNKIFPAEKLNKAYFVDENNKYVPNDRTIIFVKEGIDFANIEFSAPDKIEEIYFFTSEFSVSAEKLQKLTNAKIFLKSAKIDMQVNKKGEQ